jgi:hypothetical protein
VEYADQFGARCEELDDDPQERWAVAVLRSDRLYDEHLRRLVEEGRIDVT